MQCLFELIRKIFNKQDVIKSASVMLQKEVHIHNVCMIPFVTGLIPLIINPIKDNRTI